MDSAVVVADPGNVRYLDDSVIRRDKATLSGILPPSNSTFINTAPTPDPAISIRDLYFSPSNKLVSYSRYGGGGGGGRSYGGGGGRGGGGGGGRRW